MPDSTHYEVYTDFLYRDRGFNRGIEESERNVRQMSRSVGALQSGLEGAATRLMNYGKYMAAAAAGIAVYGGYKILTQDLIGYNAQLEQMRIGIGGAVSSMVKWNDAKDQAENFTYALGFADDAVQKLRDDAKASVGTTQDFVGAFNMLAGPIANTGLARTDQQLMEITRDFTRLGVAAGGALLGGNSQQAVADLMRMLSGAAGAEQQLARIFGLVGDEAARFNKLDPAKRYQEIYEKLILLRPVVDQYGKSWEGVTSTLQDSYEIVMGEIGAPLFDEIKNFIGDVNQWLGDNETQISRLSKDIGEGLVDAVKDYLDVADISEMKWSDVDTKIRSVGDSLNTAVTGVEVLGGALITSSILGVFSKLWGLTEGMRTAMDGVLSSARAMGAEIGSIPAEAWAAMKTAGSVAMRGVVASGGVLGLGLAGAGAYGYGVLSSIEDRQRLLDYYKQSKDIKATVQSSQERYEEMRKVNYESASRIGQEFFTLKNPSEEARILAPQLLPSEDEIWVKVRDMAIDYYDRYQKLGTDRQGLSVWKTNLYNELVGMRGMSTEDWSLLNEYLVLPEDTTAARDIKSMSDRAGKKEKKIKLPKKIVQKFGPVTIHQHIARAEPDRVAISTRQALGRAGVVRMSGLRNIMSK